MDVTNAEQCFKQLEREYERNKTSLTIQLNIFNLLQIKGVLNKYSISPANIAPGGTSLIIFHTLPPHTSLALYKEQLIEDVDNILHLEGLNVVEDPGYGSVDINGWYKQGELTVGFRIIIEIPDSDDSKCRIEYVDEITKVPKFVCT